MVESRSMSFSAAFIASTYVANSRSKVLNECPMDSIFVCTVSDLRLKEGAKLTKDSRTEVSPHFD